MESSILCSLSGISLHRREYAKRLVLLDEAKFKRASAFRAFRELTTFGLVERIPGGYAFIPDVVQVLLLHMPRLRNSPIREALVAAALGECV